MNNAMKKKIKGIMVDEAEKLYRKKLKQASTVDERIAIKEDFEEDSLHWYWRELSETRELLNEIMGGDYK